MYRIVTNFVQMDTYELPDKIGKLSKEKIEEYLNTKSPRPISSEWRDWEIVWIDKIEKSKK